MKTTSCCGTNSTAGSNESYETVRIAKAKGNCQLCDDYAERHKTKAVAVISCEGACLRGEVARQAANRPVGLNPPLITLKPLIQSKPNRVKPRLGAAEIDWRGDIGAKWQRRNLEWRRFLVAVAGREGEYRSVWRRGRCEYAEEVNQ